MLKAETRDLILLPHVALQEFGSPTKTRCIRFAQGMYALVSKRGGSMLQPALTAGKFI